MLIAASGDGLTSSEDEAALGLPPPQPRPASVPFYPEVRSGQGVRGHSPGGKSDRGAPVPMKRRHLEERPRIPSKACKLKAALVAKAYRAAGQAASALHAMAILQVHQAKALKQVHKGSTDPGLMQELRTATDFALRATKVTARSLRKAMSTMVVQERHRYVDCAVGAACTVSGGVAYAAQPVSLAHVHNSTRLRDSVRQATSQVQRRSRDVGGSPKRPCLAREDCSPPGKGCNRADPSSREEAGVLQPLLHRTQESCWPSTNPGSASFELQAMSTMVVQDHHRYVDCAVGAACTVSGGVAYAAQPVSLAHVHNSTRLCDSVRQATSQVQRRSRDVGGSPKRPCLAREDCSPPGKGCNRADPSSREEAGVLQPLLHRTQESCWPSTNPGSASFEPGFTQAPVQDADAQAHYQMHPAPGLVCSDRPEG